MTSGTRHKSEAAAEKLFEKNHKQEVMTLSLSKPDLKKEVHDVWLEQMFGGRVRGIFDKLLRGNSKVGHELQRQRVAMQFIGESLYNNHEVKYKC